jgi:hypothetical protein
VIYLLAGKRGIVELGELPPGERRMPRAARARRGGASTRRPQRGLRSARRAGTGRAAKQRDRRCRARQQRVPGA